MAEISYKISAKNEASKTINEVAASQTAFEKNVKESIKTVTDFNNSLKQTSATAKQSASGLTELQTKIIQVNQAFKTLNIRSALDIKNEARSAREAFETIRSSGTASSLEIQRAFQAMSKRMTELRQEYNNTSLSTKQTTMDTAQLAGSFMKAASVTGVLVAGAMAVKKALELMFAVMRAGIQVNESYRQTVIGTAAIITTMSTDSSTDISAQYKTAKEYVESQLIPALRIIADVTALTGEQVNAMNLAFVRNGIVIDTNNQAQLTGFTSIANAFSLLLGPQANAIQMNQEMNDLLRGQITSHSTIGMFLKAKDPQLETHLALWKSQGTIVQDIGKLLSGMEPAAKDIAQTWDVARSTLETTTNSILRQATLPIYEMLVQKTQELNQYLKENPEILLTAKDIFEAIGNIITNVIIPAVQFLKPTFEFLVGAVDQWAKGLSLAAQMVGEFKNFLAGGDTDYKPKTPTASVPASPSAPGASAPASPSAPGAPGQPNFAAIQQTASAASQAINTMGASAQAASTTIGTASVGATAALANIKVKAEETERQLDAISVTSLGKTYQQVQQQDAIVQRQNEQRLSAVQQADQMNQQLLQNQLIRLQTEYEAQVLAGTNSTTIDMAYRDQVVAIQEELAAYKVGKMQAELTELDEKAKGAVNIEKLKAEQTKAIYDQTARDISESLKQVPEYAKITLPANEEVNQSFKKIQQTVSQTAQTIKTEMASAANTMKQEIKGAAQEASAELASATPGTQSGGGGGGKGFAPTLDWGTPLQAYINSQANKIQYEQLSTGADHRTGITGEEMVKTQDLAKAMAIQKLLNEKLGTLVQSESDIDYLAKRLATLAGGDYGKAGQGLPGIAPLSKKQIDAFKERLRRGAGGGVTSGVGQGSAGAGVQGGWGGGNMTTINNKFEIKTPDVEGFKKSQAQLINEQVKMQKKAFGHAA